MLQIQQGYQSAPKTGAVEHLMSQISNTVGGMPLQRDYKRGVIQGHITYESIPYSESFIPCILMLDLNRQQLTCYNETSGTQSIPSDNMAPLIIFKTDCISLVEAAKNTRPKQKFCFAIHYFGKVYYFQTQSWRDLESWIEVIKSCSKISVAKSQTNPNRISLAGSYQASVVGGHVIKMPIEPSKKNHSQKEDVQRHNNNKPNGSLSSDESGSDIASVDSHNTTQSGESGGRNRPIKAGFCVKQGALMKNWKRRYLVLGESGLSYFKNDSAKKLLRRIWAQEIEDVRVSDSALTSHRDNLMELVTSDRTFFMQFDSPNEMHSWIEEIRKHVNLPVKTYL